VRPGFPPIFNQAWVDLEEIPERPPNKFKSKKKDRKDADHSIFTSTQNAVTGCITGSAHSGKEQTRTDKNIIIALSRKSEDQT
jgi:hypothetical protein